MMGIHAKCIRGRRRWAKWSFSSLLTWTFAGKITKQFGVRRNGRDEGSSRLCDLLGMPQESKVSSMSKDMLLS